MEEKNENIEWWKILKKELNKDARAKGPPQQSDAEAKDNT